MILTMAVRPPVLGGCLAEATSAETILFEMMGMFICM